MAFDLATIQNPDRREEMTENRERCAGLCYCHMLVDSPCDFCTGKEPSWDHWRDRTRAMDNATLLDEVIVGVLVLSEDEDREPPTEAQLGNAHMRLAAAERELRRRLCPV